MKMNTDPNWLKKMAEKEDGQYVGAGLGNASTGGCRRCGDPQESTIHMTDSANTEIRMGAHKFEPDEHVAWLRYSRGGERPTRIVVCDSDAPGAFKVYRRP